MPWLAWTVSSSCCWLSFSSSSSSSLFRLRLVSSEDVCACDMGAKTAITTGSGALNVLLGAGMPSSDLASATPEGVSSGSRRIFLRAGVALGRAGVFLVTDLVLVLAELFGADVAVFFADTLVALALDLGMCATDFAAGVCAFFAEGFGVFTLTLAARALLADATGVAAFFAESFGVFALAFTAGVAGVLAVAFGVFALSLGAVLVLAFCSFFTDRLTTLLESFAAGFLANSLATTTSSTALTGALSSLGVVVFLGLPLDFAAGFFALSDAFLVTAEVFVAEARAATFLALLGGVCGIFLALPPALESSTRSVLVPRKPSPVALGGDAETPFDLTILQS
eukprot:comp15088_c0_seq1/m.11741 comp15088_c0_seq1/g.11741  ORF comp15088_c0_seq1/g.11741 comp15088_c0_seq1/m.11741 type:complete len:339 (+) comp15088_c0_seq1:61-1077(+)